MWGSFGGAFHTLPIIDKQTRRVITYVGVAIHVISLQRDCHFSFCMLLLFAADHVTFKTLNGFYAKGSDLPLRYAPNYS